MGAWVAMGLMLRTALIYRAVLAYKAALAYRAALTWLGLLAAALGSPCRQTIFSILVTQQRSGKLLKCQTD